MNTHNEHNSTVDDDLFSKEGYVIVGITFDTYNEMGNGYLEDVCQECMEIEFRMRNVPFVRQPELQIAYKGNVLRKKYKPDFIIAGGEVVEIKVMKALTNNESAQLLNYLKCTGKRVGYLINFGSPSKLEWRRFII